MAWSGFPWLHRRLLLWASVEEAPSFESSLSLSLPSSSPLDHVLLAPRSLPAKSVTSVSQYRSEQELHCYVYYVRRRRSPPTPFAPRTISTKVMRTRACVLYVQQDRLLTDIYTRHLSTLSVRYYIHPSNAHLTLLPCLRTPKGKSESIKTSMRERSIIAPCIIWLNNVSPEIILSKV